MSFTDALENVIAISQHPEETDYIKDGLRYCGKCHTPKETIINLMGVDRKVGIVCYCKSQQLEQENKTLKANSIRLECINEPKYRDMTFAKDDNRNAKISDTCKRYVDKWDDIKKKNIGILFYGDVGTGKSFYACCIANALIDKGVKAFVTNLPSIMNELWEDKSYADKLQKYPLLVIDDFGVERDTTSALEQVYSVVDARVRANKPLIVTSNLSLTDLQNTTETAQKRIYDRILEMCPARIKLIGESRRNENAKEQEKLAKQILGL